MDTSSDVPVSSQTTESLVQELVEQRLEKERTWLSFTQEQADKDRAFFRHLFNYVTAFIAALVAVASFFTYHSVDQMREDIKSSLSVQIKNSELQLQQMRSEVATATNDIKVQTRQELDNTRVEVRKRIDEEFRSEQIDALVRSVAKERTEKELANIIRSETSEQVAKGIRQQAPAIQRSVEDETRRAVEALRPAIRETVNSELVAQVNASVTPVKQQLQTYGDVANVGSLATLANNNDRNAFDQLNVIAAQTSYPETVRRIAATTVNNIVLSKMSNLRMHLNFKAAQTQEGLKAFLSSANAAERLAALDNWPEKDRTILPILIRMIQEDDNIDVVVTAIRMINARTGQTFMFPDYALVLNWWQKNGSAAQGAATQN